jgi:hypothetical protein
VALLIASSIVRVDLRVNLGGRGPAGGLDTKQEIAAGQLSRPHHTLGLTEGGPTVDAVAPGRIQLGLAGFAASRTKILATSRAEIHHSSGRKAAAATAAT